MSLPPPGPPPPPPARPPDRHASNAGQPGPGDDRPPIAAYYSPDGRFWWDGRFWRGVNGCLWWDGKRFWDLSPPLWDGKHWRTRDGNLWFAKVKKRWRTFDGVWEYQDGRWRRYREAGPL